MQHAQGFPRCHWTLLPGECFLRITRVAAMVINVACGLMAYKTQLLAYLLHEKKQISFFVMELKRVTWMILAKNDQYSM
jgi:hypothetical protein